MLGDLLQCEQLRAAKSTSVSGGATDSQRLNDVPEGVERHTHLGRMGRASGARGRCHDSTGARRRAHGNIGDYMGFNIS